MRRAGVLLPFLLVFLHTAPPVGAAEPRPNLVVILIDDLGAADLGCYGSTFHRTPHLDRMAREGLRFTRAYAAGPVCSPTRASILSGQHPARLHLTDWLPGRPDRPDQKLRRPDIATNLPSTVVTLAEALKGAGYATAHIGKWHLGSTGALPQDRGFDLNVGGDHRGTPASYVAPFGRDTNVLPGLGTAAAGEYLTDRLTTEAVKFIQTRREQPFFLYLSHFAVHTPLTAKPNLVARYRASVPSGAQTNAIYAAMIESMDESVGRILDALTASSIATNTLVVFVSDNGGLSVREGPNTPSTSNTPLRAGKGYLYEGGLRVPWIVRWPGVVPANAVNENPVVTTDLFPTLLELAGVPPPPNQALDGVSLASVLRGTGAVGRSSMLWHYPHYSNQGGRPGGALLEGDFKLIEAYESGYLELFNLRDDPGETHNLAGDLPAQANALAQKLAGWRRGIGAQMMTTNPAYVSQPILPAPDRSVVLEARDVTIHGRQVRYEPPAHKNTIGYWTRVEDWVSWDFAVEQPGTYAVEILQGCGKGSGGSEVEIEISGVSPAQAVTFTVQDTGHFQKFITRDLGRVTLTKAGRHALAIKPKSKPGAAVMDVRQIILKPVP